MKMFIKKQKKSMQKPQLDKKSLRVRPLLAAAAVAVVLIGSAASSSLVRADQFDDQINALQQENTATRARVNDLAAQASSYEDAISKLESQISSLQQAIVANQNEVTRLQGEIDANQKELDKQKEILSADIRAMYVEGQISTLEILASSKDLSDFVNKQQYRTAVQNKLKTTMDKVTALKLQLQGQKQAVEQSLKAQQDEQTQLAQTETQQSQMLAYTEGQKAAYNAQISTNQSKIADLRHQQAIANARYNIGSALSGDPNHGGYPTVWSNAPQDSMLDYWGMYNRECVSYTAFRVHQDFALGKNNHDMPYWGGVGNANQWDEDAIRAGIPVDYTPTVGSIAISNAGTWGHAMYVEAVSGNTIYVSQFNADLTGHYSEAWRYTTGLVFIHF
jgi:surface antigen/cell division protein FtsB